MSSMYRRPGQWLVGRAAQTASMLVIAGLVVVGCGGRDGDSGRLTACRLLDRSEVTKILGAPVGRPAAGEGGVTDALAGRSGCAWAAQDGSAALLVELVRTADMAPRVRRTGFSAAARFDAVRNRSPHAKAQVGLGDGALFVEEAATLHILVSGSYVTLEVAASPPSRIEPVAMALGYRAVDKLRRAGRAD